MRSLLAIAIAFCLVPGYSQDGHMKVDGTFQVTEQNGTATAIAGQDASGNFNQVGVGAGLVLTGGELKATGSGVVYNDVTPAFLVGINSDEDTITNVKMDPGAGSTSVASINLLRDTLWGPRGSHFEGYRSATATKTMSGSTTDTVNLSALYAQDFTASGGRFTNDFAWHEGELYNTKLFAVGYHLSLKSSVTTTARIFVALNGTEVTGCSAQSAVASNTVTISGTCFVQAIDGQYIDLRITNGSPAATFTIYEGNLNGFQFHQFFGL